VENPTSANRSDVGYGEPTALRFTSAYLRRLIIEAPYIYAKVTNPGGSIVLQGTAASTESLNDYSSEIGNSYHSDLIDAAIILQERFSKDEREALYSWATGLNSKEAAALTQVKGNVIRKRRQRAVEKLARELSNEQRE
jgi:hypothetical protein